MIARSRSLGWWLAPLALASWAMASCSHPATAIVVAVDSNLLVPSELTVVHVEVGGAACGDATCTHDFELTGAGAVAIPFSFTMSSSPG